MHTIILGDGHLGGAIATAAARTRRTRLDPRAARGRPA